MLRDRAPEVVQGACSQHLSSLHGSAEPEVPKRRFCGLPPPPGREFPLPCCGRLISCIGNAVSWHNETVQLADGETGEPKTVLVPRVTIVPTEDVDKATLDAIAEVSQQANGALRVKMHDKHAALVSLGKHLGLFTDSVQIKATIGRGARKRVRSRSRCRFLDLGVRKHEAGFNRM